jgi:hypothetical protein
MLLRVEIVGESRTYSHRDIFKETHKCDECDRVYSFEYSSAADLVTMKALAQHMTRQRQLTHSPAAGDICGVCKEIKQKGYCQLSLG